MLAIADQVTLEPSVVVCRESAVTESQHDASSSRAGYVRARLVQPLQRPDVPVGRRVMRRAAATSPALALSQGLSGTRLALPWSSALRGRAAVAACLWLASSVFSRLLATWISLSKLAAREHN